jgi:hypothetical protein
VRPDYRRLAALAAPACEEATGMSDQIIDAVMARSISSMRCARTRWRRG